MLGIDGTGTQRNFIELEFGGYLEDQENPRPCYSCTKSFEVEHLNDLQKKVKKKNEAEDTLSDIWILARLVLRRFHISEDVTADGLARLLMKFRITPNGDHKISSLLTQAVPTIRNEIEQILSAKINV